MCFVSMALSVLIATVVDGNARRLFDEPLLPLSKFAWMRLLILIKSGLVPNRKWTTWTTPLSTASRIDAFGCTQSVSPVAAL